MLEDRGRQAQAKVQETLMSETKRVVVEVMGGIAHPTEMPDDVEVWVIDYDDFDDVPFDREDYSGPAVYTAGELALSLDASSLIAGREKAGPEGVIGREFFPSGTVFLEDDE